MRASVLGLLVSGALAGALGSQTVLAQAYGSVFSLSTLNGKNGFRLDGTTAGGLAGYAVAAAGDINGDGITDMIVGAPNSRDESGSAYVIYGRTGELASPTDLEKLAMPSSLAGFRMDGAASSGLGNSVARAGDVNGDGIDDFAVSANGADPNGLRNAGSTYVVYGKRCSSKGCSYPTNAQAIDGTSGFRIDGAAQDDGSGWEIASVGDVNGDHLDDIILSAIFAQPNGMFAAGSSYVVLGRGSNDSSPTHSLSDLGSDAFPGYRYDGLSEQSRSGYSVSGAGDINGDGTDDFLIGAYTENGGYGAVYVLFGAAKQNETTTLDSLDGSNGFRLDGSPTERAGSSVSAVGDVNGDGFDDIIVGAMFASPNGQYTAGTSYIVFGHVGAFAPSITLANLDGSNGYRIDGVYAGDTTGARVGAAGDMNGDGYADVIIGAEYANYGASSTGSAYVVFGHGGAYPAAFSLGVLDGSNGFRMDGEAQEDYFGNSVGSGDFNHDGYDDLIIGAQQADPNGFVDAGSVYVIYGRPTSIR